MAVVLALVTTKNIYIYIYIYISETIQKHSKYKYGLNRAVPGYGQVASSCERGYEPSVSIKCREFLD